MQIGVSKLGVLLQELLKETRQEWANRVVELLYSIFCLDTQQITLTLLGTIVPNLLTDSAHWHSLTDPPGKALAKYERGLFYFKWGWLNMSVADFVCLSLDCACGVRSVLTPPTLRAPFRPGSVKGTGKTLR